MRNIYNNIGNSLYHDNMAIYKYYNVSFLPFLFPKILACGVRCDDRSEVETFPYIRCVHFSPVVSHRPVNLFKRTGRDENVSSFQFRRACHADTRSPFLTPINQRVHPFNRSLSLSAETACVYTYVYEREGRRAVCMCVCGVGGRETVGKGEREQGLRSWYILRVFFFLIRTRCTLREESGGEGSKQRRRRENALKYHAGLC